MLQRSLNLDEFIALLGLEVHKSEVWWNFWIHHNHALNIVGIIILLHLNESHRDGDGLREGGHLLREIWLWLLLIEHAHVDVLLVVGFAGVLNLHSGEVRNSLISNGLLLGAPVANVLRVIHPLFLASDEGLWGWEGGCTWDWLLVLISWQSKRSWAHGIQVQEGLFEASNLFLQFLIMVNSVVLAMVVLVVVLLGAGGEDGECE